MEYPVWSVISELPRPIREQLHRYRTWLNRNFNVILRNIPEELRSKVNKVDFVEFAILKLVYEIPERGLKIINQSLDLLHSYDIQTISITGEMIQRNSRSLIKLSNLVETFSRTFKEFGFDFVLTSKNLIELAKEMGRRDYGKT